jgi:hypothetical protein
MGVLAAVAFPLMELGTHCRGAMFLDGGWVITPELEERFDAISRGFAGFYVGRFDVRVPPTPVPELPNEWRAGILGAEP